MLKTDEEAISAMYDAIASLLPENCRVTIVMHECKDTGCETNIIGNPDVEIIKSDLAVALKSMDNTNYSNEGIKKIPRNEIN